MTTQETSNRRIKAIDPVQSPRQLLADFPISESVATLIGDSRNAVSNILHGRDARLLVVVGPCSIHDPKAALEYAERLLPHRQRLAEHVEIVMRVYFEKPRTTIGWKGLINDPDINNSFNVDKGLRVARQLLLELNTIGMPAGTEFLDAVGGQYYADLISWGAIGARTTESQIHRELASGLSCPVGFKNGTNGNLKIAMDAVKAANAEHSFLSPTEEGTTALFHTTGNQDAHVILRGGKQPNYDAAHIAEAKQELKKRGIGTGLMVDFSHANSGKEFLRQKIVAADIAAQVAGGEQSIRGCMIESHLVEGRQDIAGEQPLAYGQSITDACLGFTDTIAVLDQLADAVQRARA